MRARPDHSEAMKLIRQHAQWQSILQNKLLFILLLRQQKQELLILFFLYLFAMLSLRFSNPPAAESHAAYRLP